MRAKFSIVAAAMLAVAAINGCGTNTITNIGSLSTSFALRTVNGKPLPYKFNQAASTVSVQADTYVLYVNNSYSETIDEILTTGSQSSNVQEAESGIWFRDTTAVTFSPTSSTRGASAPYTGVLGADSTLTITVNDTVSVYSRR